MGAMYYLQVLTILIVLQAGLIANADGVTKQLDNNNINEPEQFVIYQDNENVQLDDNTANGAKQLDVNKERLDINTDSMTEQLDTSKTDRPEVSRSEQLDISTETVTEQHDVRTDISRNNQEAPATLSTHEVTVNEQLDYSKVNGPDHLVINTNNATGHPNVNKSLVNGYEISGSEQVSINTEFENAKLGDISHPNTAIARENHEATVTMSTHYASSTDVKVVETVSNKDMQTRKNLETAVAMTTDKATSTHVQLHVHVVENITKYNIPIRENHEAALTVTVGENPSANSGTVSEVTATVGESNTNYNMQNRDNYKTAVAVTKDEVPSTHVEGTPSAVTATVIEKIIGFDMQTSDSVSPCTIQDGNIANCYGRNLTQVPNLPINSRCILLNANQISNISTLPFRGMNRLQSLDLSSNPLRYISPFLFAGLTNLTHLNLKGTLLFNQWNLDFEILFKDTKHMRDFRLTFSEWPIKLIKYICKSPKLLFKNVLYLHNIQVLELDSVIFKHMIQCKHETNTSLVRSLALRDIQIVCGFWYIQNKHFLQFPNLHTFSLYSSLCLFLKVDTTAFSKLLNLSKLALRCLVRSPDKMDKLLSNITTAVSVISKLESLWLDGIGDRDGFAIDGERFWANVSQLKALKTLKLNRNGFYFHNFMNGFVSFPPLLTTLDVTHNCFQTHSVLHMVEGYSKHIEYIYAEFQNLCGEMDEGTTHNALSHTQATHPFVDYNSSLRKIDLSYSAYTPGYPGLFDSLLFFPNLTHMHFSWLRNRLNHLNKIRNEFSVIRPGLVQLELIGCQIYRIETGAFTYFGKGRVLTNLSLAFNNLGEMGSNLSQEIKGISSLQHINLTTNQIKKLDKHIFKSMLNLKVVDLSGNLFETFPARIEHLKHLDQLDISNNRIRTLSHTLQHNLDKINQHTSLKLKISGNPLICTCDTIGFLKWIINTEIDLLDREKTSCFLQNGTEVSFDRFHTVLDSLHTSCATTILIEIAVSVSVTAVLVILTGVLIYKFRWKLRYLYHITKFKRSKIHAVYEKIYDYDAFISYSTDDFEIARTGCMEQLENIKGLKVCIHERDFQPGRQIAYNISVGIHSSRRTILFVSSSFLESTWCMYELNIARMEALYTKRGVIVIVMLEGGIQSRLPIDILDIIRTTTYLEYPEHGGDTDVQVFWDRLAESIN